MNLKRKMRKGFTLVELVVVIAVIAVLAAVSVGAYFGVTDSANSSAATNYHKQAKDLWMFYAFDSNGGYLESRSLDETGKHFCVDFNEEQGANLELNYQIITINETKESSSVNSLNRAFDETLNKDALLIKVEGNYSTWFIVDDLRIVDESEVLKNDNDFDASVKNSKYVITEDGRNYTEDTFALRTLTSEDGSETVKGVPYVQYNVLESGYGIDQPYTKTIYAKNGISLSERTNDYSNNAMGETPSGYTVKLYDVKDGENNEYDTTTSYNLDNKFIEKMPSNEDPYGYVAKVVEVKRIYRDNSQINFSEYEATVVTTLKENDNFVTKYSLFDKFDDVTLKTLNIDNGEKGFIILNNASLTKKEFILKSGYTLILEYELDNISSASAIDSTISNRSNEDINRINRFADSTASQFTYLESDKMNLDANYNIIDDVHSCVVSENSFNISKGSKLICEENTTLKVEAFTYVANDSNGMGIGQHSVINNEGTIELASNSKMRTLGRVNGYGLINAKNESTIIDLFKLTSFNGGTLTSTYVTEGLPLFKDYLFDNIECKINFECGSNYQLIGLFTVNDGSTQSYISLHFVGDSNSAAFIEMKENSILSKELKNGVNEFSFVQGEFSFTNVPIVIDVESTAFIPVTIPTKNMCDLPFCLSHIGLVVDESAALNINEAFNFRIFETCYINVKGTINLSNGAQIILVNNNPNSIDNNFYNLLNETFVLLDPTSNSGQYKKTLYQKNGTSWKIQASQLLGHYKTELVSFDKIYYNFLKANYYNLSNPNKILNISGVVNIMEDSDIFITGEENLNFSSSQIKFVGEHSIESKYNYNILLYQRTPIFDIELSAYVLSYYYKWRNPETKEYEYIPVPDFIANYTKYDSSAIKSHKQVYEFVQGNTNIINCVK